MDRRDEATLDRDTAPAGGLRLRILATSDVHMHLLPFDYLTLSPSRAGGLARAAALIARHRAGPVPCLLLDNGDFLQGTPLGDHAAAQPARRGGVHPAIAAMNALRYDAAALGNHDFNFGLRLLRQAAAQADFPLLSANLSAPAETGIARWTILTRQVGDISLRIGVIGFLPPQTEEWDRDLRGQIRCADIVETARVLLPQIRAAGAQLVVALAHSGIGPRGAQPRMEHAATALAALPGIDVIVAGHTHQVFPGPDVAPRPGVDPVRGTLAGKPAAMPGQGGSHLAVIDLTLRPEADGGVRVAGFKVACQPVGPELAADAALARHVLPAHQATLKRLQSRVARSSGPLCSHFTVIGRDPGLRLVAQAQAWHVRRQLRRGPWQDLPVLSSAAPFRAGGRGGPDHYTDIPPGTLRLRHLSDLYGFPNRVVALCLSGAQLRDWLERSASLFRQIVPGSRDAPLLDPEFPIYNFDVIVGLDWRFDLSRPARFAPDGALRDPEASRVRDLTHRGHPLDPEARFILATNSYRLASCGLFAPLVAEGRIVLPSGPLTRDALRGYLRRRRHVRPDDRPLWRFVPQPGDTAVFPTAPTARPPLDGPRIEPAGQSEDGFALMRFHL